MVLLLAGLASLAIPALMLVMSLKRATVPDGHVLLVRRRGSWIVRDQPLYVLPIQSTTLVSLNERTLEIPRGRYAPITCADGVIVDIRMAMTLKVNDQPDDLVMAARHLGCEAVNDDAYLVEFFGPKLVCAVSVVAANLAAADFLNKLDDASERVREVIGSDLDGFTLLAVELRQDRPDAAVSMGVFR